VQATGAGGAKRQGLAERYMRKKQRIREPACLEEARCLDGLHAQWSILIAHTVLQAGLEGTARHHFKACLTEPKQ